MTDLTDLVLVQQVQDGNEEAIAAIFDRHSEAVYSIALRVLGDKVDAETVLQETLLSLWRTPQDFLASQLTLSQWMAIQARNMAVLSLRKATQIQDRVYAMGLKRHPYVSSAGSASPESRRSDNSFSTGNEGLLALAFFEGKTLSQICELTGNSPEVVRRAIVQASSRLKSDRALVETEVRAKLDLPCATPERSVAIHIESEPDKVHGRSDRVLAGL